MRKKKIIILALLACLGVRGFAQDNKNISGYVLDKWGKPVSGAIVTSIDQSIIHSITDKEGKFEVNSVESMKIRITTPDQHFQVIEADATQPVKVVMGYASQGIPIGYEINQNLEETTSSVFTIYQDDLNKRSERSVKNSLYGNVLGLTTLRNNFYVRGIQSLTSSGNDPLILVDGIEREIGDLTPEEVESVTVLKDAAAVALYGYKGANGAMNIVTKRGKYNAKEIKFSYDHAFNWQARRPKFADATMYANAVNEALAFDGQSPRYSADELNAFQSGSYPYLYPNVDWINETFRNSSSTDIFNLSFRGGGGSFRYYALLNLQNKSGYIKNPNMNDGYSTQDKYSKGNLRVNLDIDLTPKTKLVLNLLGTLAETSVPGDTANLWDMIYTVPAVAFPIKTENNLWGGNVTWDGTKNPVAQAQAAGYTKTHTRSLLADMTLKQDLSGLLPGLGANVRFAYDNKANYIENHSKTYVYGSDAVIEWVDGKPAGANRYTGGADSGLGAGSDLESWVRVFNFAGAVNYNQLFGDHSIYSQLKWDYEYRNKTDINNTWYRQNISLYTHYGYKERYFADLTLVASGANKLAPSNRWGYSPTLAVAWVLSKEGFMQNISFIDFLKLRASAGLINRDYIPAESYWEQIYTGGKLYNFDTGYASGLGSWTLGRLSTLNPTHEKALKYNLGMDATLFKGLNLTADGYFQRRKDIWVESKGKYSSVLGFDAPYENGGIVDSWGVELGADYTKRIDDFAFNIGSHITWAKNKIKEQYEEPQLYSNLERTGKSVGQIFGLIAEGFFKDQADIDNSIPHLFNEVKPGDIKYRDVNGDNVIDANDETAIGYNTLSPEIYYSFKLGAEWKGFGFNTLFQGTGNYSAILNLKSVYKPLIDNTTISTHYYENRWTPETPNAKYPRLSAQSNNNNFKTNTIWVEDRSFLKMRYVELYYDFPKKLVQKTTFMNKAKLYVRGTDLLCFDKIKIADPENYNSVNPTERSIVIGLSLGF